MACTGVRARGCWQKLHEISNLWMCVRACVGSNTYLATYSRKNWNWRRIQWLHLLFSLSALVLLIRQQRRKGRRWSEVGTLADFSILKGHRLGEI